MTFIRSSWHKLRERIRKRQWPLAVALVLYFLHHVVGTFLALSGLGTSGRGAGVSAEVMRSRQLSVLSDHFGCGNFAAVFAVILGVILAMQGFAYLDDRQQAALYEGRPGGRRKCFLTVNGSSILIFLFSTLSMKLLGLLLALCMHVMSPGLLLTALYQSFREFCIFLGIYGLTTLAMMLCGNLMMAFLVTIFLMTAEFVLRILLRELRLAFFWTAYSLSDGQGLSVLSSPLYYYTMGQNAFWDIRVLADEYGLEMTVERVRQYVELTIGWDLCELLLALLFLLLAYLLYRMRPDEAANRAVVFRPARIGLKLAVAVLGGLGAGYYVYHMLGAQRGGTEIRISLGMVALIAFLLACLMEGIYGKGLRHSFRHARELLACVFLALLSFSYYCFDLSGYNHYVPKRDKVAAAQLFLENVSRDSVNDGYASVNGACLDQDIYLSLRAEKTASAVTNAVLQLARIGMQYTGDPSSDLDAGYRVSVLYTMKNGDEKARSFVLPPDIDAGLMDAVIGSESYHEDTWQFEGYPFEEGHSEYTALCYYVDYNDVFDGGTSIRGTEDLLEEFREVYRKDMQQYSFSFARDNYVAGKIVLRGEQAPDDAYSDSVLRGYQGSLEDFRKDYVNRSSIWTDNNIYRSFYNISYEVYPSYSNTIAFLKKYGLYMTTLPEAGDVQEAKVYEVGTASDDEAEEGSSRFTEEADIAQLLPNLVSRENVGRFHTPDQFDDQYTVCLTLKSQDNDERIHEADYRYLAGKVPTVVTEKSAG